VELLIRHDPTLAHKDDARITNSVFEIPSFRLFCKNLLNGEDNVNPVTGGAMLIFHNVAAVESKSQSPHFVEKASFLTNLGHACYAKMR
jgi:hypothetical protein